MKIQIPYTSIISEYTVINKIYGIYSDPKRSYHNWHHIEKMIEYAWENDIHLTYTQELAILFHDIVYNVGGKENEFKSAELFEHGYAQYFDVDSWQIDDIKSIIMSTANHTTYNPSLPKLHKIVLDLDLLTFGNGEFLHYNALVLDEFGKNGIDQSTLLEGQLKFFTQILSREKIYYQLTDLEQTARRTLEQYVNFLTVLSGISNV